MNISFQYNWPPGKNSVRVSLGMANVEDVKFLFRVGVVKAEDNTKVYWQGASEWLSSEEIMEVTFDAQHSDVIVVEKQNIETEEIVARHKWDTARDWPAEASGGSSTHVPFIF